MINFIDFIDYQFLSIDWKWAMSRWKNLSQNSPLKFWQWLTSSKLTSSWGCKMGWAEKFDERKRHGRGGERAYFGHGSTFFLLDIAAFRRNVRCTRLRFGLHQRTAPRAAAAALGLLALLRHFSFSRLSSLNTLTVRSRISFISRTL